MKKRELNQLIYATQTIDRWRFILVFSFGFALGKTTTTDLDDDDIDKLDLIRRIRETTAPPAGRRREKQGHTYRCPLL